MIWVCQRTHKNLWSLVLQIKSVKLAPEQLYKNMTFKSYIN